MAQSRARSWRPLVAPQWRYSKASASSEGGAARLKRFSKEQNWIERRPANAARESHSIAAEEWERDWAIEGKVQAIFRFFDRL